MKTTDIDTPPLIKRKKEIQRLKIRFALLFVFSHLLAFLTLYSPQDQTFFSTQEEKTSTARENYVFLKLPLKNYAELKQTGPVDVMILNSEKKVLVKNAHLYPQEEKESSLLSPVSDEEHYVVEVPSSSVNLLVSEVSKGLYSWPLHEIKKTQQGSPYEIIF